MNASTVRIVSVEIHNFKNVKHGFISIENPRKDYKASVLGLYGQNGSGKTALIDALSLLKFALTGKRIPPRFADYICVDAEHALMKYTFEVCNLSDNGVYSVEYQFAIRKDQSVIEQDTEHTSNSVGYKVTLFDEVLSYAYKRGDENVRLSRVIDTRTNGSIAFTPKTKYNEIIGDDEESRTRLMSAKYIAHEMSCSFIFFAHFINIMRQNCKESRHGFLLETLFEYGHHRLFVIRTDTTGLISIGTLPLTFNYARGDLNAVGNILLNLDEPSEIPEAAFAVVCAVIENMNIVLQQLVPGLSIGVKRLGSQLLENGVNGVRVQLLSNKNSREIPLKYESEGIKKLISILQLLISAYNNSSMTIAIDELDSGIFEYLLGEILRIFSESGRGQLIFTSHNLRPLETLDKHFIAFTTTNPENRYVRMSNVKTSNNLRDFYYRDIILNEQEEELYDLTNNSEIALAFREAGVRDVR